MKILNLKFKNINSLLGENEIDFTQSAFTNDGLFAITGKTGSGKSSILDAISLAFYGKTPRVDITGSENAVMTRGEKDCYSEVIFEVAGKKWKSSWKQELTRNRTLKPVKRIIADFDDKIIADQLRACDKKIEKIIGLTFQQFTKVILLAQGSFAAFLQAKKNEKGELLEQITGTEIYAKISQEVFNRDRLEKEKLDKILVEVKAIKILSEEETKDLADEIDVLKKDKNQIDEKLQKLERAKQWLSDLADMQNKISENKQKLPKLEENSKAAKENFEASVNAEKKVKEEKARQEPLFRKVRELDTKISEKEKLLQPIINSISELKGKQKELSEILRKENNSLINFQKLLHEQQSWAIENKKYEELISTYKAIEKEKQSVDTLLNERNTLNTEVVELQKKLDSQKNKTQEVSNFFNEKEKKLKEKIKDLEAIKSELSELLGGKERSEFTLKKETISSFCRQIKDLIDVENRIAINEQEIEGFDDEMKQFEISNKGFLKQIDTDEKNETDLKSQIKLLEDNIELTKIIQSLEEHRHNLKDRQACPLCGSVEHPFALGNLPQIGDNEKRVEVLVKELLETTKAIQQSKTNLAKLVSDKENTLKNKIKEEENLSANLERKEEIRIEIESTKPNFSIPKGDEKVERLNVILAEKRTELKTVDTLVTQAISNEKKLKNLRDKEIPILQEEKQNAAKAKNKTETAQKLAEQKLETRQGAAVISQEKYKLENATFLNKLNNYGVENIEVLKKCLDDWNNNKEQAEELKKQITTLKSRVAVNNKDLDTQIKSFKEKEEEKQGIETDKKELSAMRKEIFDKKSVDEEEARLRKKIEDTEVVVANSRKESLESNSEFEKNKAIITEKERDLLEKEKQEITQKTSNELQIELDENKIKANEFLQKIGGNTQMLKSNTENLKNSGSKLKEKEKQQAVCNKWGNLNKLIGSGDGKKYRNFAQALTFEYLIGLSNIQLQKMSDRYILKRIGDTANPFDLSVIDKFQNSEERTAQNLSGGEKFIVSLSLALGLANMVSKNMTIDTMFIDEGFGTLDSDYLDVALNALSNLQNEGKVIGVISHLTELKERIATHIEVVPSGNGHSMIQITN